MQKETLDDFKNFKYTSKIRAQFAYEECVKRHDYTLEIKKMLEANIFKTICAMLPVMFIIGGWSVNVFPHKGIVGIVCLICTAIYLAVQIYSLGTLIEALKPRKYSLLGWLPTRLWHKSFLNLDDVAFYYKLSEKYNDSININNESNSRKVEALISGISCFVLCTAIYAFVVVVLFIF